MGKGGIGTQEKICGRACMFCSLVFIIPLKFYASRAKNYSTNDIYPDKMSLHLEIAVNLDIKLLIFWQLLCWSEGALPWATPQELAWEGRGGKTLSPG